MYFKNQESEGMHTSEAVMLAPTIGYISLVVRYPNELHIKSVQDCEFFDEFQSFSGRALNQDTIAEMKYLQKRITDYCEHEHLYYYFDGPVPEMCERFPIIELVGI